MSGNAEADMKRSLHSEGENLFGGRIGHSTKVVLSVGFPHGLGLGFRFPWGGFELAPHLYFDYGNPFGADIDLGSGVGIGGRIHVFGSGPWDVALRFDFAFDGRFHPGTDPRFNLNLLDPGVRVSVNVDDVVDIDFGLDVLPQLRFRPNANPGFGLAVPLMFGVEGDVAPGVQLGFTTRAGPSFNVLGLHGPNPKPNPNPNDFRNSVGPYLEVLLHVGVTLGNVKKATR